MRAANTIFDASVGALTLLDTGLLDVSGFDQLMIRLIAGGAAPTGVRVRVIDDDRNPVFSIPVAMGVNIWEVDFGPGLTPLATGGSVTALAGGPVPRTIQIDGTSGAAGTLRFYVLGYRTNDALRG